jgi:hypothetical protein
MRAYGSINETTRNGPLFGKESNAVAVNLVVINRRPLIYGVYPIDEYSRWSPFDIPFSLLIGRQINFGEEIMLIKGDLLFSRTAEQYMLMVQMSLVVKPPTYRSSDFVVNALRYHDPVTELNDFKCGHCQVRRSLEQVVSGFPRAESAEKVE